MKHYNLLFSFFIVFFTTKIFAAASAEEFIGPVHVKHLTDAGIQQIYIIKRAKSSDDLLSNILGSEYGDLKNTYVLVYSTSASVITFETFKDLFKKGTSVLAAYLIKKEDFARLSFLSEFSPPSDEDLSAHG